MRESGVERAREKAQRKKQLDDATLLQDLIKHNVRQTDIARHRQTPTRHVRGDAEEINATIDAAKVADLGAKLFYLSGMINDHYLTNETKNLARFIYIRPMPWRQSHPYVLCDRFEDLTDAEKDGESGDVIEPKKGTRKTGRADIGIDVEARLTDEDSSSVGQPYRLSRVLCDASSPCHFCANKPQFECEIVRFD